MLEQCSAVRTIHPDGLIADQLVGRESVLRSLWTDKGLAMVDGAMTLPKGDPCPEAEIRAVHWKPPLVARLAPTVRLIS
jgi:hypothetical protein